MMFSERNSHIDFIHEYVRSDKILKNGKRSKKYIAVSIEFCPLNQCDICKVIKGAKWVSHRNVGAWNFGGLRYSYRIKEDGDADYVKNMLCMSCYNKVKAILNKLECIEENKRLIYLINKEIAKNVKNKDNG